MMKGFIKVCYYLCFDQSASETDSPHKYSSISSDFRDQVYIGKKDILQVTKIESFDDMISWVYHHGDDYSDSRVDALNLVFLNKTCVCDFRKRWHENKDDSVVCKCIKESDFPIYIAKCANKIEIAHTEIKKDMYVSFVPRVATYIVDQSERENMERFLAGTDDPLYDYVHLLQYGPNGGTEVAKAKEEFESAVKKQKTNASTNA